MALMDRSSWRAAAPVLVQLYEGLAVVPEAGQTCCLPRDAAAG